MISYAYKIEPVFLGWTGAFILHRQPFACSHTGRAGKMNCLRGSTGISQDVDQKTAQLERVYTGMRTSGGLVTQLNDNPGSRLP